jgi:predicted MPP superfamily phosphohydrolase
MRQVMLSHPQVRLLVLCGHTHSGGQFQAAANIDVLTGEARYGHPVVQQMLQIA